MGSAPSGGGLGRDPILRVGAKLVLPPTLLFGLYVQFHADLGPGGGFQAGIILAVAIVLYGLVFGIDRARRVVPEPVASALVAAGVLIFGGVGVVGWLRGGAYLDYDVLAATPAAGQHLGIILVELGVCATVAGVMLTIYFSFAGRRP
ncbi:MAG: Na(+)/H(+) antiporter subunit B [Alphaproteobacteria bacterium]|nr:Na(+)/H(+) antiporter subunit B [Alphaproteobacteria bacterium]